MPKHRLPFAFLAASAALGSASLAFASDLQEETAPATNPGALRLFTYAPENLAPGAPMVVVLHGCSQTADDYVTLSGWQTVADEYEFLLVAPEQQTTNNFLRCFNWFEEGDVSRGEGEARSIAEMVSAVAEREGTDPERIFVTGLSAGGFMTSAMLAAYPDVFSGGAPVAGGPVGCAKSSLTASTCMNGLVSKTPQEWADEVLAVMPAGADLPKVSIWHGENDFTVSPKTSEDIAAQWTTLHGLSAADATQSDAQGHSRTRYGTVVEHIELSGMGHAVPVAPGVCGMVGSYAEDVGVCASLEIARFWGLTEAAPESPDAGPGPGPSNLPDAGAVTGSDAGETDPADPSGCTTAGTSGSWLLAALAWLLCLSRKRRGLPASST